MATFIAFITYSLNSFNDIIFKKVCKYYNYDTLFTTIK